MKETIFVFFPSIRLFVRPFARRFTILAFFFFLSDFCSFLCFFFIHSLLSSSFLIVAHPDKSPRITSVGFYFYSHVMLCFFFPCFSWRRRFINFFSTFFLFSTFAQLRLFVFVCSHGRMLPGCRSQFSKWLHSFHSILQQQQQDGWRDNKKTSRNESFSLLHSFFFFCDYISNTMDSKAFNPEEVWLCFCFTWLGK